MKIKQISISQYKSLGDNARIRFLSNQVVLVGRNEAGKSNVLEALSGLRIFEDMGADALPLTKINRTLNGKWVEVAIDLVFHDEDISVLDGIGNVPDDERACTLIIKRGSEGLRQTLGAMFSGIIRRDTEVSNAHPHVQRLLGLARKLNIGDSQELRAFYFGLENYEEYYVPKFRSNVVDWCVRNILPHVQEQQAGESYKATLVKLANRLDALYVQFRRIVPKFFRFYDEYELHSTYQLDEVVNRRNHRDNNLVGLDRYLGAIGLTHDEVFRALTENDRSLKKSIQNKFLLKTERVINEFNKSYLNGEASVRLMPSFDGNELSFSVVSDELEDTVLMGERSAGLRWYLNVFFELKRADLARNYVLLIDEPAIHMHVNAQREVLNLFSSLATGSRHLIYTTHSPYMIDTNHMENIKAVIKEHGVAIIADIHCACGESGAQDAWTPVCEALGVSLRHNVGPCSDNMNLICEGPSDACYISAMLDFSGISKDQHPNVIAAMGVSNVHNIASILLGWGYRVCIVVDNDRGGQSERNKISDFISKLNAVDAKKDNANVVFVDDRPGKTIEALISDADHERLFGCKPTEEILRQDKMAKACKFVMSIKNESFVPDKDTQHCFFNLFRKLGISLNEGY